jgi:hypothetical protein
MDEAFEVGEDEAVAARFISNSLEFDGIKTRGVDALPHPKKLDGVAAAQPIANDIVRVFGVFEFGDVGQANAVLLVQRKDGNGGAANLDGGFFGFAHDLLSDLSTSGLAVNYGEFAMMNSGIEHGFPDAKGVSSASAE